MRSSIRTYHVQKKVNTMKHNIINLIKMSEKSRAFPSSDTKMTSALLDMVQQAFNYK